MTVAQAAKGTQLSGLKKQGEEYLVAFIVKCINDLSNFVKLEHDTDAVVMWAEMIAVDYWYFKAEELIKAFMIGVSKKQFGAINYGTICECLDDYEQKKLGHATNRAADYKESYQQREKTDPKAILLSVDDLKKLGKL